MSSQGVGEAAIAEIQKMLMTLQHQAVPPVLVQIRAVHDVGSRTADAELVKMPATASFGELQWEPQAVQQLTRIVIDVGPWRRQQTGTIMPYAPARFAEEFENKARTGAAILSRYPNYYLVVVAGGTQEENWATRFAVHIAAIVWQYP